MYSLNIRYIKENPQTKQEYIDMLDIYRTISFNIIQTSNNIKEVEDKLINDDIIWRTFLEKVKVFCLNDNIGNIIFYENKVLKWLKKYGFTKRKFIKEIKSINKQ